MNQNNLIQTDCFVLSETERSSIEHEMYHYEDPRAASIETLETIQKQRGWVPDGAIPATGEALGIPASDIEGVTTFHSQIFRRSAGRHIIRVCDSMVCYVGSHEPVVGEIQEQLGIGFGQTITDGHFTLLPICCLDNCDKAPALMIDDDTRGDVRPNGVTKLLEVHV